MGAEPENERIFLIGFMGSGKSTMGKKVAGRLGYSFVDLDALIVERAGQTIPEIFAQHGEAAFRQQEQAALHAVLEVPKTVISCGGGTPCFFDNMQRINASGYSVYLRLTPRELAIRLAASKTKRPLIEGKSGAELEDFIASLLAKREGYYEQAKLHFPPYRERLRELVALLENVNG